VGVELLIIAAVLVVVVAVVSAPLRRPGSAGRDAPERSELDDLEAAKEAKYREIRDAELDYRTGKLSEADWRALDGTLRAEAVELLKALDALRERAGGRAGVVR
jgi:hypothetical protein